MNKFVKNSDRNSGFQIAIDYFRFPIIYNQHQVDKRWIWILFSFGSKKGGEHMFGLQKQGEMLGNWKKTERDILITREREMINKLFQNFVRSPKVYPSLYIKSMNFVIFESVPLKYVLVCFSSESSSSPNQKC